MVLLYSCQSNSFPSDKLITGEVNPLLYPIQSHPTLSNALSEAEEWLRRVAALESSGLDHSPIRVHANNVRRPRSSEVEEVGAGRGEL